MNKMTIIVPVFQTVNTFRLFLDSLIETLYYPSHIIFINDGSGENINVIITEFAQIIKANHKITLLKNSDCLGCSKSINSALKLVRSDCDIVVFMDSDLILAGDWQSQVISSFKSSQIGIVGGILLYPQTGGIQCCGISFNNTVGRHTYLNARLGDIILDNKVEVQTTVFAFCAIKYEAIKQTGELDEQFFNGYEDWDYQFRIRKNKYTAIINTKIVLFHWEKSNGLHRSFNQKSNLGRFWLKHGDAVVNDFWSFSFTQISAKFRKNSRQYRGINLCGLRDEAEQFWLKIKEYTNLKLMDISDCANLCNTEHSIWLPQILDSGSISSNIPYLFLCDNFIRLLDNDYWYQLRQNYCSSDIIMDLYGNSMLFSELRNSFWPGTKIR